MEFWRKCSSCKKPIAFKALYWVCNVSTCNRKRTGLVFCTVSCWDAHLPDARHRESWAEERKAPSAEEWARELSQESGESGSSPKPAAGPSTPRSTATTTAPSRSVATQSEEDMENQETPATDGQEVLVVASKLKNYIKDKSGMNTSAAVMGALSERIRGLCDQAIESAKREGRKTVMDRDFQG